MILPKSVFSNTKYFGISLDSASLKAVSLDADGKIQNYAQMPLVENVVDGEVTDPKALTQSFQKLKDQGHFSSPYTAVVLPESYAFTRELSLPTIGYSEIDEAISWQISQLFPFSADEVYVDWKLLTQDDTKLTVLVVAVPKKLIDGIRASMGPAGLYPVSFEPSISALSPLVSFQDKPLAGLVEVNQRGVTASLIKGGVALLTTTNPVSTQNPSQTLIAACVEAVNTLLRYYAEKHQSAPESIEFHFTGDRADQNLINSLKTQVKHEVKLLVIDSITPSFHRAYAAAASHVFLPQSEKTINLLPADLQTWYQNNYQLDAFKKLVRLTAVGLLISLIIGFGANGWAAIRQNQIQGQLVAVQSTQANSSQEIPVGQIITKANRIKALFPQKITPQEQLSTVIELIPASIKVETISYEATTGKFQIFGITPSREDLLELKNELESQDQFTNISLPLGNLTSGQNTNFSLEFEHQP